MDILLASGSPRRRELLTRAQLDFSTLSVDIDETPNENELPKAYIERMVATKADAAIKHINQRFKTDKNRFARQLIVLTADTIGVLADGKTVLVKPVDREHAYSMWQQMSDKVHEVWTAVQATQISLLPNADDDSDAALIATASDEQPYQNQSFQVVTKQQITDRTQVTFIPLTIEMMRDYWDSGEPADKAGGYGIQGFGATWVSHINGSYTNVVGLPLSQTLALIKGITG